MKYIFKCVTFSKKKNKIYIYPGAAPLNRTLYFGDCSISHSRCSKAYQIYEIVTFNHIKGYNSIIVF